MHIRVPIHISIWLLVTIIVIDIFLKITGNILFDWIGLFLSVWLFLNLYWIGIWVIAHWGNEKSKQHALISENTREQEEIEPAMQYEPLTAAVHVQTLQQSKPE